MMQLAKIISGAAVALLGANLCLSALPVSAASADLMLEACYLEDRANVLTYEEEAELDELIADTASTIQMNVVVCLGNDYVYDEEDARQYAVELYQDHFGSGETSDGVALYLDLYGTYTDDIGYDPYDYIVTHGAAQLYYTNSGSDNRIQQIFDQMNPHMERGEEDPYTAVTVFCSYLVSDYDLGVEDHYYAYDDTYDQYLYMDEDTGRAVWSDQEPAFARTRSYVFAFMSSFVIGLIVAIVTLICIKIRYRFKSAPTAQIYTNPSQIHYYGRVDHFLRQHVTRTKIEHNDHHGGGGFSGGGGMSSGGFGGGGNHR